MIHTAGNVFTVHPDRRRDEWETKGRPTMKKVFMSVLETKTTLPHRALIDARTGNLKDTKRRLYPHNQRLIVRALRKFRVV
jgi:hypothetical protein